MSLRRALAAGLAAGACLAAQASGIGTAVGFHSGLLTPFCQPTKTQRPGAQDRVLRFAGAVQEVLSASGQEVALISRSGLDLRRFGLRYSHAGVMLKDGGEVPWSVRQLYFDCDEGRPRLFDQGLAGFLMSADSPDLAHVSIVFLPREAADALLLAAQDRQRALRLLAATYSANAYPFSLRYQNCNQWVAELLATAWGALPDGPDLRQRAQDWLRAEHYRPTPVHIDSHLTKFAGGFMPLLHLDDHPSDAQLGMTLDVSLPAALEAFVHARWPQARRVELCLERHQVLAREGWAPMDAGCQARAADRVVARFD
ncbi:DUF2145 domain-containing protein [Xenophilus arseniciresistens]|uniref:DUF2145 domain-containing protein n=1 Tax=Xenophilus arseniciresistens TaxID=1283306 RepID=A0AAE3NBK4_9BURK|nr:DUF2145 domain-containing protein [Xenophilus arseniciresistens]MDA7418343.1 DUF2145 domain-containing protein [Xenophilus arseniciresistens]